MMPWDASPYCFNPRTRVGCDADILTVIDVEDRVSIHAPAWGATPWTWWKQPRWWFQSTHPRGVRQAWQHHDRGLTRFQSTHPRGVRHDDYFDCSNSTPVSIHAPAWGATTTSPCRWRRSSCFNPRTRVGCDSRPSPSGTTSMSCFNPRTRVGCDKTDALVRLHPHGFNPRTRVGCDLSLQQQFVTAFQFQSTHPRGVRPCGLHHATVPGRVSIHAPAWGATSWRAWPPSYRTSFNPRTRVGCDDVTVSTGTGLQCFNPRTRVGCDAQQGAGGQAAGRVSIHAPAWGATSRPRTSGPSVRFQSTHPRGVRRSSGTWWRARWWSFNPRTRVGCDRRKNHGSACSHRFQSTHPRGVRLLSAMRYPPTT